MGKMLEVLKATKSQFTIELDILKDNKDTIDPIIIDQFFRFEDELNKMLFLFAKIQMIRDKKEK